MPNPVLNEYGAKQWFDENGNEHREDGPAYEGNTVKVWRIHGKRHRLDGPAVEWVDGTRWWCYQDEQIFCNSQQEFERLIKLKAFW